jgi:hypothetical protein
VRVAEVAVLSAVRAQQGARARALLRRPWLPPASHAALLLVPRLPANLVRACALHSSAGARQHHLDLCLGGQDLPPAACTCGCCGC